MADYQATKQAFARKGMRGMTPQEEMQTRVNIAQHKAASLLQTLSIIGGLIGTLWHGLPALIAGLLGAWLFHYAKPGPNERLDKANGRK